MKTVSAWALLGVLLCMIPAVRSEDKPGPKDVNEFVAKVVSVSNLRVSGGKDLIVIGGDPRFLLTIDVFKSDTEREKTETRQYAIHSPTLLFGGVIDPTKAGGRVFTFKESTLRDIRVLEVMDVKEK